MSEIDTNQLIENQPINNQRVESQLTGNQRVEKQLLEKFEILWKNSAEQLASSLLARAVGYGMLLFFLLDLTNLFIPPNFMNPAWELQTFGGIIERIAIPLLGMMLLFWGGRSSRFKFELPLLKSLSWLALVGAILLFLAVPLGIFNTVRIYRQSSAQITAQVEQSKTQIKQIQDQLSTVTTQDQMQELLSRLSQAGRVPEMKDREQLERVKKDLDATLSQGERSLDTQAQTVQQTQRLSLFKNSVKWNLGAIISGCLFLWVWLLTDWARRRK